MNILFFVLGGLTMLISGFAFYVFLCRAGGNWFHGGPRSYYERYWKYDKWHGWLMGMRSKGSWNDRIIPWLVTFIVLLIASITMILIGIFVFTL